VQITLRRYDEYMIWLEDQSFRDQFDRHLCVTRENLVELGGNNSQVINDDDRNAHIGRHVP
jgi:hypothetical protein